MKLLSVETVFVVAAALAPVAFGHPPDRKVTNQRQEATVMFSYTSQETTHPRLRRLGARARTLSLVLVAVGATLPAGASAHPANLVADGGFESPQLSPRGVANYIAPKQLGAWTVGTGNVDLVNGPASEGAQSVDLDGTNSRGELQQDLTTVPGHSYTITFALGANRGGAPALKRVLVGFGTVTRTYTYNTATQTGWQAETIVATATASTTRLRFQSTDDIVPHQSFGPMIDDVWVSQT